MALPGEINAPDECEDCKSPLPLQVLMSGGGYYIGTFCPECGPYSRESDYFPTREAAQAELDLWLKDDVRPSARTTDFQGMS